MKIKRVNISDDPCFDDLGLTVVCENDKNEYFLFNGDGLSPIKQGQSFYPPRITKEDAQKMADSLWECGIRPSAAKGSAGQLDAVEKHLKDMRKIVFKKLQIEEPK